MTNRPSARRSASATFRFRVIGLLSPRGANMMGQDQDDCVLAPWTTMKFRVSGLSAPDRRSPRRPFPTATINTLNNPYPMSPLLYPQELAMELADTPQPVRQTSVDYIQAKAVSAEQVPVAIEQIDDGAPRAASSDRRRKKTTSRFSI